MQQVSPQAARALVAYISRAGAMVGTPNLAEARELCSLFPLIEGVANGELVWMVAPANEPGEQKA